jgi:hypothetical protein
LKIRARVARSTEASMRCCRHWKRLSRSWFNIRVRFRVSTGKSPTQKITRLSVSPLPGGKAVKPYTFCAAGKHNSRDPEDGFFRHRKASRARASGTSVSLTKQSKIGAAPGQNRRCRVRVGSRLDADGEGAQSASQMAVAPQGAGLISTAPTGGGAPSSLIAAAAYVLRRPAYPYRKRENRKSGATKNRPTKAWSPSWRGCRPLNTTESARTRPRRSGSRSQRSTGRSPSGAATLMRRTQTYPIGTSSRGRKPSPATGFSTIWPRSLAGTSSYRSTRPRR